ncbi:MAG: hypothetical protein IPJ04_13425 [Candidatus Eisenbacteria bacterium]|nr:hypothetical protein [Candidatus Eisenbacteria bacterium]
MLEAGECRSFPDNLESEATLTFASETPGAEVRATAPTPQAVTIVQHQSLVRVAGRRLRRARGIAQRLRRTLLFADYAQPVSGDVDTRWLARHRLESSIRRRRVRA